MNNKHLFFKTIITVFFLFFSGYGFAQDTLGPLSPEGTFEKVFDRFGNQYEMKDIAISTVKSQTLCLTSGYFNLYFEAGSGFEQNTTLQINRRNVLCQLFSDLSAFIIPANINQKVNIWVRDINVFLPNASAAGVLGMASSFYTLPSNAPSVKGIVDGEIWKTIHSGQDSYTNVSYPLYGQSVLTPVFYHGVIAINFSNQSLSWHLDLNTLASAGTQDLYTVGLHEITHALGFNSLIAFNGLSSFSSSGFNYYSRYDSFLKNPFNQNLITNSGTCSLYNYTFNPALNAISTLAPDVNNCILDNTNCGTAIKFAGSVNQAVYTPNCYDYGSSLSHLEEQCHLPGALSNNQYYVMSNSGGTGAVYTKRYLKPEERDVLCELGYKVNNVFGNNFNSANQFTYTGSVCPGLWIGGINDGFTAGGAYTWFTTVSGSVTFTGNDILANDFNATDFECLESVYPNGIVSVTGSGPSAIIGFTATAQGVALLRYVPKNSSGQKGNITYIFIMVGSASCIPTACNMINNSGFESGNFCGGIGLGLTPATVDCWSRLSNLPKYYSRSNCSLPGGLIPTDSWASNPPSDSWNGVAGNNNHFIGLNGHAAMQAPLSSPILPNVPYALAFWVKLPLMSFNNNTTPANLRFNGGPSFVMPPVMNLAQLTTLLNNGSVLLASITISPSTAWQYVSVIFTHTGLQPLNSFFVSNMFPSVLGSNILIDDITLLPAASAASFTPPAAMCFPSLITNLSQYATPPGGVFTGNQVVNNNGIYSFNPSVEGTYEIVYTYTNNLGCVFQIPAQIDVIRPDTPTLTIAASSNTMCLDAPVTLTVTGASVYTWSPAGNCVSPCNIVNVNPPATTIYTVYGNYGLGCTTSTAIVTVSVTGPSVCCVAPNTVIVNNTNSSSHATTLSNLIIDVLGIYNINTNVVYNNITFRMAPGSKFIVNSANTMTLTNCKLFSCTDMWDGIYLNQSGALAAGLKVLNGTSIEDAINGIVANSNNTSIGSIIQIENSFLNKNYKSIQVQQYTGNSDYPLSIKQSTINCTNSPYSLGATLKAPYMNNRSNTGVLLTNVKKIKIGSSALMTNQNLFNNLDYGIYATKTDLTVLNNRFTDCAGSIPPCPAPFPGQPAPFCPPSGIAIFMPNVAPASNSLIVGGSFATETNTFINVMRAVEASYVGTVSVIKNTFNCVSTSPSFPQNTAPILTGQVGVLTSNISGSLTILSNTFANFANTISHTRNDVNGGTFNPVTVIQSNTILAFGATGYVSSGIHVNDLVNNTLNAGTTVFIRNNNLVNIRSTGISLLYIKNRPVVSGTGNLSQSINMLFSVSSSNKGINLVNCDKALVTNNRVASTGNSNVNMHGIYLQSSTNSLVRCNYIYNTGHGITIHGDCTGPYIAANNYTYGIVANTFTATGCGIRLRNSGKVGQQGDATHPTFNTWLGTAASYAMGQTRTDAGSLPANSVFYCISNQTSLWPTNHQTASGIPYANGTTVLTATGSSPACPGPSAIEELPDPGETSGGEVAGRSSNTYFVNQDSAEKSNTEFKVYPNPNSGLFYIECSEPVKSVAIRVMDLTGRVVLKRSVENFAKEILDLSTGDQGLYMIEIINGNNTLYYKLIKN